MLHGKGALSLAVNADAVAQGSDGDVRDVVLLRDEEGWEIGISCKHNHDALKHPRITEGLDFGKDWVGYPCSVQFLGKMRLIAERIRELSYAKMLWKDVTSKVEDFYIPILNEHLNEIQLMCETHDDVPERLLSYFFGSRDFYKVIANDSKKTTTIEGFNMHGTLNKSCGNNKATMNVSRIKMPTKLLDARFKDGTDTTIVLTFNDGWVVSMRLHNKDKEAKTTSLAWDVKLVGYPTGTFINIRPWYEI